MQTLLGMLDSRESDSAKLDSAEEYEKYFNAACRAMRQTLRWFESVGERRDAAEKLKPLLASLLGTLMLLRQKYRFDPLHKLALDLNESGYPTVQAFDLVKADSQNHDQSSANYPSKGFLMDQLVEALLADKSTTRILEQLGQRSYLDGLKEITPFVPFTPGTLNRCPDEVEGMVRYEYTFGTFCQVWNVPNLYHMVFDLDAKEGELDENHPVFASLLRVLTHETSYEAPIGVVATNVDTAIPSLRPKIIQRLRLGPFWSLDAKHPETTSPFYDLLSSDASRPEDFVLELLIEAVYSKGTQSVSSGFLGLGKSMRESFFFPNNDQAAVERRASYVTRWLMMPHRLHQQGKWDGELSDYQKHRKIFVDSDPEGSIHETH